MVNSLDENSEKINEYPNLKWAVDNPTIGDKTYLAIHIGWYKLVDELIEELKKYKLNYTVGEIKSKYGGLRFYTDFEDYGILNQKTFDKFQETIHEYENKSYYICEYCGSDYLYEEKLPNGAIKIVFSCSHF